MRLLGLVALAALLAGCAQPGKRDGRGRPPASSLPSPAPPPLPASSPSSALGVAPDAGVPIASVAPPAVWFELRKGEPSDALFVVASSPHVEARLFTFAHDFACVATPLDARGRAGSDGAPLSLACDPNDGAVVVQSEPSGLVIRKAGPGGEILQTLAVAPPLAFEARIRSPQEASCAGVTASAPMDLALSVVRPSQRGDRVVQLRAGGPKAVSLGAVPPNELRCRGWAARAGDKAVYQCDAPDWAESWTVSLDGDRIAIVGTHADADRRYVRAVGALRVPCGRRAVVRAPLAHRDANWYPMGGLGQCGSPCTDAYEGCDHECSLDLTGDAAAACAEKCRSVRDACRSKRCTGMSR